MLISYPILPAPAAKPGETELEAFIGQYVDATQGLYPVSLKDRWHGGIHLKPGDAPVRAIADGEVVAYRVTSAPETYKNQDFDTSFVLLKHTTETGEKTPVVFYSLYMHLLNRRDLKDPQSKQLPDWLQKTAPGADIKPGNGQLVWRKDVLGFGGQLYGDRHVHFEIFTPDIHNFWKDSKTLAQGAHGSDDFFGDAYFVVPLMTHFLATHPHAQKHKDHKLYVSVQEEAAGEEGWSGGDQPATAPVSFDISLGGIGTKAVNEALGTDGRLFVRIRYDKGKRIATSFQINANGNVEQIGPSVEQDDYEYNLYPLAKTLYPDCPSAGYEWLRFGRVLGPDTTTHQENWQYVRYGKDADAVGYVDLAATNITKLSDADFPFWQGWQTIDDDNSVIKEDGICDVSALQALLGIPTNKQGQSLLDPPDFVARANDPTVARKLRHLICKFNSEWDDIDVETRYKRLYQSGQPLESTAAQNDFKKHVTKMAFWSSTGLPRSVWHFHPLQFIEHYRKCTWLALNEIRQLLPAHSTGGGNISWDASKARLISGGKITSSGTPMPPNLSAAINNSLRKYVFNTPLRLAHFFGQTWEETGVLTLLTENGDDRYFRTMYEVLTPTEAGEDFDNKHAWLQKMGFLRGRTRAQYVAQRPGEIARKARGGGNTQSGDGPRFKGRGMLQITWRNTYTEYGMYRDKNFITDPNPSLLATNAFDATDVAGWEWTHKYMQGSNNPRSTRKTGYNIHRRADAGSLPANVEAVTVSVNGGTTGLPHRQEYFAYAYALLGDEESPNRSVWQRPDRPAPTPKASPRRKHLR